MVAKKVSLKEDRQLEGQLGLAKIDLGLAPGYVPEVPEGCRSTWSKALPISTGLYSLVKLRQVEVAHFRAKSGENVRFSEPLPLKEQPSRVDSFSWSYERPLCTQQQGPNILW